MMKQFSPEEILSYAKRQVEQAEKQRFVKSIIGLLVLVMPVKVVFMLHEKSEALQVCLPLNEHFLLGVVFGVLFTMVSLFGGMLAVGILRKLKGIEHQVLKRLIELEEQGSENK